MNAKKHRRRAPKLTQKADRGSQSRRVAEGKSNIAAKRVTLLPGFLINGFTSNTVQKTKEGYSKRKNHLLNDDLQAYLEQKGKHPRRSQRILKKHVGQQSVGSKTSNSNQDSLVQTPLTVPSQSSNHMPNNINFKSILKNNSKSLFKDISDRFSKVNICNTETGISQKPVTFDENQNMNQNFDEICNVNLNQNPQYLNRNHLEEVLQTDKARDCFRINLNRTFCRNLENQISVTFKRNAIDECRKHIRKEIELVKMAVEGKAQVETMTANDPMDDDDEAEHGPPIKFYPVPAQNWVYSTPPNQKIGAPQVEECQLQAAVLHHNNNQQNLYEVRPMFHVDFSQLQDVENVPIDDRFMKKVAQVKRTPAPVSFRFGAAQALYQQPWGSSVEYAGGGASSGQMEYFVNPNVSNVITHTTKQARSPIFTNYLESYLRKPQVHEPTSRNFGELQDCTFIEEGNDFKMQESQPMSGQRNNKRRLSEEDFVIKRRNVPVICDKGKMFDFGSQETNLFDFGKV